MTRPDPLLGSTDDGRAHLLEDTDVEILTGQLSAPDPVEPDEDTDDEEEDEEGDGEDEGGVA